MIRWELEDENLFKILRFYLQGTLTDDFLDGSVKALGDLSFKFGQDEISKENFQKSLCSWFEGMAKSLAPEIKRELTEKQRVFVASFLLCGNGSEAARKAGYSEKMANRIAYQLLRKPLIKQEIDKTRRNIAGEEL